MRYPRPGHDTTAAIPLIAALSGEKAVPARFLLAALATVCPAITADRVLPRLGQILAPEATARADSVALIAALLTMDSQGIDHALREVARWHLGLPPVWLTPAP